MGKDQTPTSETRSSRGGFWFGCQSRLPDWTKERRDLVVGANLNGGMLTPPADSRTSSPPL